MVSRVALVKTNRGMPEAYQRALELIGGRDYLEARRVTVKVGIYDRRNLNYPTVQVVKAVADSFANSEKVLIAESENHNGKALERLQVWKEVFSNRVMPFDLSHDADTQEAIVCGEKIRLSSSLFKPNFLVSLHVLRRGKAGSIFKNLLGLIPDIGKERFHDNLGVALIDLAEAVGWIDLAVLDGTYMYGSEWKEGVPLERERRDVLVVGRDPVAVETVGSLLAGEDPLSVPPIAVAHERDLSEADINQIEILGEQINSLI